MVGGSRKKEELERRIEAALRKRERGEELTEGEWILVQYTLGAGTCHSCGRGVGVAVSLAPDVVEMSRGER